MDATYVLPIRRAAAPADAELAAYLATLGPRLDLVVVDGSPPGIFDSHRRMWASIPLRHVRPDPEYRCANGKVAGVLTGVRLAHHERVVIADDDVRYDEDSLGQVLSLFEGADLVRPQNFFDPLPWHARWDTARTLLNRARGGDYPGTFGVRRSLLLAAGGYDGDVLFENLELIRTVKANGGRVRNAPGCYVRRLPPSAEHFLSQRIRQAYDDLAQPLRLLSSLAVVPVTATLLVRRQPIPLVAGAAMSIAAAEAGRRRNKGRRYFPITASLLAPLWVGERAMCSWLAIGQLLFRGGCPYGGTIIVRAANPQARLRRRSMAAGLEPTAGGARTRRG